MENIWEQILSVNLKEGKKTFDITSQLRMNSKSLMAAVLQPCS